MNGSIPTEKGKVSKSKFCALIFSNFQATMTTLLESLPSRKQAIIAAATARVLSHFSVDEIYLPSTPSWMFGEEGPKIVFQRFCNNLQQLEEEMEERNINLRVPYTILLPSKIPAGISI